MSIDEEIFYHVFQRSFYDSNNDRHGDLKGVELKLDYIQELGCTSILLTPLYKSIFYHNYFADSFRDIDPKYGTAEDLIDLIKAVHERGMKIYMDMEVQYITENHIWYKDAFKNPDSKFSDFILFNGPQNTNPESIIFHLEYLDSYDGTKAVLTTLNLNNETVKSSIENEFLHWLDPLGDGTCGVDGFRIDHMMDDLDDKGILTGLLEGFWNPLIRKAKEIKHDVLFLGEQGNWDTSPGPYFEKAGMDVLFAFDLMFAIRNLDKWEILNSIHFWRNLKSKGRFFLLSENHDTDRVASNHEEEDNRLKLVAILNLFLPGVPMIYYGQELGMTGAGGFQAYGNNDGNDIPRRRFFPWNSDLEFEGHAYWYKDSGPWWEEESVNRNLFKSVDKVSHDKTSLFNFYKRLTKLRSQFSEWKLKDVHFTFIEGLDDKILGFRWENEQYLINVVLNLSGFEYYIELDLFAVDNNIGIIKNIEDVQDEPLKKRMPEYGYYIHIIKKVNMTDN